MLGIGCREDGRRLVENDHVAWPDQRARELREAELGHAQPARRRRRVERTARSRQRRGDGCPLATSEPALRRQARLHAEHDVAPDGELRDRLDVLGHVRDAVLACGVRTAEDDVPTVDFDRAGTGQDGAGEQLHERRLARAVLADERMHLAPAQLDGYVVECDDTGISLRDAAKRRERLSRVRA
jgi:hypothetical protein